MGRRDRRDREFSDWVAGHSAHLTRTAYLLCGDRHRAEDLVQITLTKLYVAWERVERADAVGGYARKILVNAAIDESRRPWRREYPDHDPATRESRTSPAAGPDAGVAMSPMLLELRKLPPRQRAAAVLRYWQDLSVKETARLMGCTPSTVKTQSARGLDRLRGALSAVEHPTEQGASHD